MPSYVAARCTWVFGRDPDVNAPAGTHGAHNNVAAGSTASGTPFNTHGYGLNFTFMIENTDSAMSYQIRSGRTSSGPWSVMSSNSFTSTSVIDHVQLPGPLGWISPRVDAMASSVNTVIIRMTAVG